jgi:hypothetical protein
MGKFPKNNFEQGRSGKQFDPGGKGDKRGANKSWTDKLKSPKGGK